jgi:hypothetical protein
MKFPGAPVSNSFWLMAPAHPSLFLELRAGPVVISVPFEVHRDRREGPYRMSRLAIMFPIVAW